MNLDTIIAIDPGTNQSAMLLWDGSKIGLHEISDNASILRALRCNSTVPVYCEMIASYGMAVGREVFETCVWIGRFQEAAERTGAPFHLIYRRDVKMWHCQSARAKDTNVNQALRDKYGAKGTKKSPGVTYPLHSHLWSAFAIATYVHEQNRGV